MDDAGKSRPSRPLDFTVFGVLFLLSAPVELANIIMTGWNYSPKFFGMVITGAPAKVLLLAQPVFHLLLGYGFLTLRKWAFYLAVFYAADTLTSTVLGFVLHGYGRIRTIFLVILTPFLIYVLARRKRFTE